MLSLTLKLTSWHLRNQDHRLLCLTAVTTSFFQSPQESEHQVQGLKRRHFSTSVVADLSPRRLATQCHVIPERNRATHRIAIFQIHIWSYEPRIGTWVTSDVSWSAQNRRLAIYHRIQVKGFALQSEFRCRCPYSIQS